MAIDQEQLLEVLDGITRRLTQAERFIEDLQLVPTASGAAVAHTILDGAAVHTDSALYVVVEGALAIGNNTPLWDGLPPPGVAGYALVSTAPTLVWDQTPTWSGLHAFGAGWALTGGIGDLNGLDLIIDADGDTFLHASADDVVDLVLAGAGGEFGIWINGAEDFNFTANSFNVPAGSVITMADDTTIGLTGGGLLAFDSTPAPDQIKVTSADLNFVTTAHGIIHVDGVAAGELLLADGTRYVPSGWFLAGTAAQTYTFGTGGGTITTSPGTLTVATPNAITAAGVQTHAITSSSNPGVAARLLATDALGHLILENLGLGIIPNAGHRLRITNAGDCIEAVSTGGGTAIAAVAATGTGLVVNLSAAGAAIADFQDGGVPILTIQPGGQADFAEYLRHLGDPDTYLRYRTDRATLVCGGATMIDAVEAGTDYLALHNGLNFIGDTANANMTVGLTINQGVNDNEICTYQASEVNHGMTDVTETDTYKLTRKISAATGGALVNGFSEDTVGMLLAGSAVNDNTAKSTSGLGYIILRAQKKSGTGVDDAGADANLVVIRNNATTRFIFDAEGTGHADVAWAVFSDRRLKRDIAPTKYGLADVLALQPVDYVRKEHGRVMVGLLAQDVHEIIPEATWKPTTDDSYWGLDYNSIVPVLVRSDQELHAEIAVLRERIQELENGLHTRIN